MLDVKACVVCLSTSGKLYKIDSGQLQRDYFLVSGLKADDLCGMPQFLCVECTTYVSRFKNFRDKCKRAHYTLKELLKTDKQITKLNLDALNRKLIGVIPNRSYLNLKKVNYETAKFKWEKSNRISVDTCDDIPVFHCSTIALENEFEVPRKKPRLSTTDVKEEITDVQPDYNETYGQNDSQLVTNDDIEDFFDNNNIDIDIENDGFPELKEEVKDDKNVDGMNLEEEYASVVQLSMKEATAAFEIYKMFSTGKYNCKVCNRPFLSEKRYSAHLRMHDQYVSGPFKCSICNMYYKSEFLLKTHMTEKHMYKYICKKCPEVSFDRMSAKQHFIWAHLQKGTKKDAAWYDCRPSWLSNKGGKRRKGIVALRPIRKIKKLPPDFPICTPVPQEEQYQVIQDRKKTRNYLLANFQCELCFKGFRGPKTFGKHMKKHDPEYSGPSQCDMCKLHFPNARKMYKHMMITHVMKFSCQICDYICYNKSQAHSHYRWHKDVTYTCPHCLKVFKKLSSQLTHIRIKHPSTKICNICGHSFVSDSGLHCHKRLAHSQEEMKASEECAPNSADPRYCADCDVTFVSDVAFATHLGSSNKHADTNLSTRGSRCMPQRRVGGVSGVGSVGGAAVAARGRSRGRPSRDVVNNGVPTPTPCEVCQKLLPNDVQARKHYETEHPGREFLKRYMCDVCGHATKQYANLMVHMRTHTQEKPYECPHCERRFSMPSNRDRHIVVHTGEKKYQCQHCNRRFTQSSAVKLHIQTVHLKIPYAPWDKKNRKRRKELEASSAAVTTAPPPPTTTQHKLLLEPHADYLNAYITYNDE